VGSQCCFNLKMAKDVVLGDHVWLTEGHELISSEISHISLTVKEGLHNPLMKKGGFPVINGIVTSYNTARVVKRNAVLVPLVEWLCPSLARLVVAVISPKPKHYLDGQVVEPFASIKIALILGVIGLAVLIGCKLANKI